MLESEDNWPPVAVECLPCVLLDHGYRVEAPPLFVKGLSVGDIISVVKDDEGNISSWEHISKSKRSTIWLLRTLNSDGIEQILQELRSINCNTVQLVEYGCYSIDVPEKCLIEKVDAQLARFDPTCVAIAYPSFRHEELTGGGIRGQRINGLSLAPLIQLNISIL